MVAINVFQRKSVILGTTGDTSCYLKARMERLGLDEAPASCGCYCTLEVERSGLAVEALDLSNSIKAFSKCELVKHADAQRRVHPEP